MRLARAQAIVEHVLANAAGPVSVFVSPWYGASDAAAFTFTDLDPRVRVEPSHLASLVLVFDRAGVLQRVRALRQP